MPLKLVEIVALVGQKSQRNRNRKQNNENKGSIWAENQYAANLALAIKKAMAYAQIAAQ